jgi:hypothetical protein
MLFLIVFAISIEKEIADKEKEKVRMHISKENRENFIILQSLTLSL